MLDGRDTARRRKSDTCRGVSKVKHKAARGKGDRAFSGSNLPLDVDLSKGSRLGTLKEGAGLACQEDYVLSSVLEQMLALLVNDELGRVRIRLEREFCGEEPKLYIGLVAAKVVSIGRVKDEVTSAYPLQMLQRAARRSLTTNISIRYAPMLGVSK